jgi:glycosyltransferase involved in cell wall biosynthesis
LLYHGDAISADVPNCGDPMKVTIVIPTFNRASDLSELLDSILKQTTKPLEIIIVDDNTPNDTTRVVSESYATRFEKMDGTLIYAKNPRVNSLTISRNIGVNLARGDIVMFFDDDMILSDNYIEKILEVFKMHPDALGVQGWIPSIERKKKKASFLFRILNTIFFGPSTRDKCRLFSYPTVLTQVINCEALCGGAMAIRREVFSEFVFDENLKKHSFMEDDLFSYSIFQKYPKALFITPFAKVIHKKSQIERPVDKQTERVKEQYRRYVLVRLFGKKGHLLYFWQSIDIVLVRTITNIAKRYKMKVAPAIQK